MQGINYITIFKEGIVEKYTKIFICCAFKFIQINIVYIIGRCIIEVIFTINGGRMMKKITRLISLTLIILILCGTVAYAEQGNNQAVSGDMYVPVKFICETMGGQVSWDTKKQITTVKVGNNELKLFINRCNIILNGKSKVLKEKVKVEEGRTILSLSVLNSQLGLKLTCDDYIKLISVKFVDLVKAGKTADSSNLLSKSFSKHVTTEFLKFILVPVFSVVEPDVKTMTISKNTVHQNVFIPFTVQQAKYNFILRFDYSGKIDEFNQAADSSQFTYSKPSYDNSVNYTEREVTIGEGEWKLPGTLTMPKGKGPFPALILVHGSGSNDRDETLGPIKPFRDLAVGLASQGVAVLRYEKRTLEYGVRIQLLPKLTMTEEFEEDAFAAAKYLKTIHGIDTSNITVLGHSEGGYDLPRILGRDKTGTFKAGIIMSGCSRPLYELLPEQYKYLAGLGMATDEQAEAMKAQVALIQDKSFDPANPPEGYSLGMPYYFNDMKNYDVIGTARQIDKPILVLQGERDYQVSPKTDYEGWKKAFEGKSNVQFKLYPKLNHMYMEGEGQSTPVEYYVNGNIPQYVINDIAGFIKK